MNTRTPRTFLLAGFFICASLAGAVQAQTTAPPLINPVGGPAAGEPAEGLLGERFESASKGLSFLPPAGCRMIKQGVNNDIVEYISDEKSWALKVTQSTFEKPMPLEDRLDPVTRAVVAKGLLEITSASMLAAQNAVLLRKDMVNAGDNPVGLVMVRFTLGPDQWLRQQAILQANDQLYYIFSFTTPGGSAKADPKEELAVKTFSALLDSVKLIDRTAIKDDQNARLYRTRSLFVSWTPERFNKVMREKSYVVLQREGKNVGYSFAEELPDSLDGNNGVNIYVRTRNLTEKGTQVETGSKMFTTFDRKHEQWAHVAIFKDAKGVVQDHSSEWGSSDVKRHSVFNDRDGAPDPNDRRQPKSIETISHFLDVTFFGKKLNTDPIHRDLPPFYLPQALGQMLPRLVPLDEAKTYLFASYVNESREVMLRYVEVTPLKEVLFNGQKMRVSVVSDRIGLEGSPTLHYFNMEGEYVGSENRAAKIVVLPTTAQTILRIWPDAVLSREEFRRPTADAGSPGDLEAAPQRGLAPPIR